MKRALLAGAAMFSILSPAAAWAEDDTKVKAGDGDIIVTATRESTLLSKTPITMTAVSAETLRNAGISDARSLSSAVPGIQISENGDAARISIRGVTSTDNTEKGDPSASFLVDGIYIARPADVLGSFFDVSRIEVLRGPQGTLYGRNTTAGVINVIAARPTDSFEAKVDGTFGNLGTVDTTGVINVGLGNGIGVRAAINYQRQDSYFTANGPQTVAINPYRDAIAARLAIGGKIGDNFTFYIKGDYLNTKGTGVNGNLVTLDRFYTNTDVPGVDPTYISKGSDYERTLTVSRTFPNHRNNKNYGITGEFTYDFGPVQLTYLGAYRKTDRNDVRNLLLFGSLNNPAFFFGNFKQDSHELRLAFGRGSALHGQIGGYYFHEKSFLELNLGAPLSGLVVPGASGFAFPQGPTVARSKAVFGQLTYDITPALHITGGVRYTHDFKSRDGQTVVDFPNLAAQTASGLPAALCNPKFRCTLNQNVAARDYNKTIYKVGLDYDVPGLGLIYAAVSTGYKAGGFNDGCVTGAGIGCNLTPAALYFEPETLIDFEAGLKFRLSSQWRVNAALFHYNYNNLQVSQIVTVPVPATLIRNAASAKVDGVEIETQFQATDNDKIEFGYTYTNARYSNFTVSAGSVTRSFAGKPLDHAPKNVVTLGYVHTFPLANGGKIDFGARSKISSSYVMQDLNNASFFRQPSYSKTDLTATYTAAEDRYYIQGFVKNVEDKITIAAAATGLAGGVTIEEPRTFGVRVGAKF